MTEATTFNKEEFVKSYVEALREDDANKLVDLIAEVDEADKPEALAGVIEAIEADEELAKTAAESLGVLKRIKEINDVFDGSKAEANTEAKAEVQAPSIKVEAAEETSEEETKA